MGRFLTKKELCLRYGLKIELTPLLCKMISDHQDTFKITINPLELLLMLVTAWVMSDMVV